MSGGDLLFILTKEYHIMGTLTHSLSILIAACVAMLALWGEHYHPWKPNGGRLDIRWNYVLGVLAMLLPYSILLGLWAVIPPAEDVPAFVAWALAAMWVITACSGILVYILHEWDAKRDLRERAESAEAAERISREPAQGE